MEALEFLFEIQNTRERTLPLVLGIFLLGIGALVLADLIWWRLKSAEFSGKIIGFLNVGSGDLLSLASIIQFTGPNGALLQGKSDSASSNLGVRTIGKPVTVLFRRKDYPLVRVKSKGRLKASVVLVALGLAVIGFCLESGTETWLFYGSTAFHVGLLFYYLFVAKPHGAEEAAPGSEEPPDFMAAAVSERTLNESLAKAGKANQVIAPITLLVAIGLVAAAGYFAYDVARLQVVGARADGAVTGVDSRRDGGGKVMFYAKVRYTPAGGGPVDLIDRFGSSAIQWDAGDAVTVVYDPADPTHGHVDHGSAGNFVVPVGFLLAGILLLRMTFAAFGTIAVGKRGIRAP